MSDWIDRRRGLLTCGGWICLLAWGVLGAFQVFALGRNGRTPERLPQLVRGDDALAVAFGGARETISLAMAQKANSYFHGGIDMDCHGVGGGMEEGKEGTERGGDVENGGDWWQWINAKIRAPQVHRHLDGDEAVEILPWFWAAVKSDPHNAEAWSVAWHTALYIMNDRALADRILREAKTKNPDSIEIAFTEGRALYDGGKGDVAAAKRAFARTVELADAKSRGDASALSPREEEAFRFAKNYLKTLEEKSK